MGMLCYFVLAVIVLIGVRKCVHLRNSIPVNWQPVDRRNLRRNLPLTAHEFILKAGQLCVLYSVWQRQTDCLPNDFKI